MKLLRLLVVIIYIMFYINFFTSIIFIPSIIFKFYEPEKSKKYFTMIKNIILNSTGFITKLLLLPNIYTNSNDIVNLITNNKFKKNLIVSNHPTELDFLLNSLIISNTDYSNVNLNLAKKEIGYILPSFGFFGILVKDIFLHRNIKNDMCKLNKKINFNTLLLYPEGTCFNSKRKLISDNYCVKNNLMKFKYHLYPRTTGLELIIKSNPEIKYIYDITIVYDSIKKNDYGLHYNIINFMLGKFELPNKVFFQISKYKINKYEKNNKHMIENIYISKDKFVEKFNSNFNNFIPMNYNFYKGFSCFAIINLISLFSIYLFIKLSFIKYLYFFQFAVYYIYFYLYV